MEWPLRKMVRAAYEPSLYSLAARNGNFRGSVQKAKPRRSHSRGFQVSNKEVAQYAGEQKEWIGMGRSSGEPRTSQVFLTIHQTPDEEDHSIRKREAALCEVRTHAGSLPSGYSRAKNHLSPTP